MPAVSVDAYASINDKRLRMVVDFGDPGGSGGAGLTVAPAERRVAGACGKPPTTLSAGEETELPAVFAEGGVRGASDEKLLFAVPVALPPPTLRGTGPEVAARWSEEPLVALPPPRAAAVVLVTGNSCGDG